MVEVDESSSLSYITANKASKFNSFIASFWYHPIATTKVFHNYVFLWPFRLSTCL